MTKPKRLLAHGAFYTAFLIVACAGLLIVHRYYPDKGSLSLVGGVVYALIIGLFFALRRVIFGAPNND